ncbi:MULTISPECIES: flagellar protein MotY [Corallincola]|uniref:OmpA family protein n=3 Tax=Corallincola TaxID=1775176 RepID=A0A368NLT4_9GAMM|nr:MULTISPECIES: OmpA family protein [Corallincola]RCU50399.1 OmpA family protein [Corallincola holothuriorum]TAA48590.1 OmpA family protein [Corallincola spongiicola]TCI05551.1 OmpA family protein [Corallincola luteus]
MRLNLSLIAIALIVSQQANAGVRTYAAGLENSQWALASDSRLECRLEHKVPHYGEVSFSSKANKLINLNFDLDMRLQPAKKTPVALRSVPPSWKPGLPTARIGKTTLYRQFEGRVDQQSAWVMLHELEKGMQPTLYYSDWNQRNDEVAVGLSAVNFRQQYYDFLSCVDNLLPYSFDDISYTVLNYQSNSDKLNKESQRKLEMIGEYLKLAPTIELVLVDAYSDSYGGRWHNEQLSIKRAQSIKDYLKEQGLDDKRIRTEGHGEKRHIATNETTIGRNTNRRVVIRMSR